MQHTQFMLQVSLHIAATAMLPYVHFPTPDTPALCPHKQMQSFQLRLLLCNTQLASHCSAVKQSESWQLGL